jgi:hypothetical protein
MYIKMADEREVNTDVDRLIQFVKDKKEISIEDAAKQLGMPAKTVEALSDLLEEEGILHIKYKFTTPYLTSEMTGTKAKKASKESGPEGEFVVEKDSSVPKIAPSEKPKVEIRPVEPIKQAPAAEPAPAIPKIPTPEPLKKIEGAAAVSEMTDIDQLIKQANEAISKGDFDSARKIYLKIKQLKDELPKIFLSEDKKVKGGLADVNESIMGGIDKALLSEFETKAAKADSLFRKADEMIRAGKIKTLDDVSELEKMYKEIKEIYFSLPNGFMDRKVSMQDKMLEIYRSMVSNKKLILADLFKSKAAEIETQMNLLSSKINAKDIAEANKVFHSITHLYKGLPAGFLKEKTEIQNRILSIYQELILNKEKVYSNEIKIKADEINALLLQTTNLLNIDNLRLAEETYRKMTDIYSELPEGYYDIRTGIEMKMLEVSHLLSLKKSKAAVTELNAKVDEISLLAKSVNNYIDNREYDLAKEAYNEAINLYNSLPEGFVGTNMKIREKISKLYKDLLSLETGPMIGEADKDTVKIYSELLQILVQIHDNIKKKEFGKMKDKYLLAYKLYHELPLSFIEKKISIYTEIYKVYEELKAYSEVTKLPAYAEKGDYFNLKNSLNRIIDLHGKLISKYPEDMELFKYIHGQCLIYLDVLKGNTPETGKQVRDKINNLVELKKSSTIEKTPELIQHQEAQSASIDMTSSSSIMPGVHPVSGVQKTIEFQDVKKEALAIPESLGNQGNEPAMLSANVYLKKKYGITR